MIPLEPITALVGLGMGMWSKVKQQQNDTLNAAIMRDKVYMDDTKDARKMTSPGIQYTRRIIAFAMVGTYCAMHLGISVPELLNLTSSVTVGYTEVKPGFLFLPDKEVFKWHVVEGSAITPAFNHAVMLLLGFYFGAGGSGKR